MKKDRKIKSAGMSDRDKNLLFIVGGILLVVLVIQFGFRNFLAENKEQKATKAALEDVYKRQMQLRHGCLRMRFVKWQ